MAKKLQLRPLPKRAEIDLIGPALVKLSTKRFVKVLSKKEVAKQLGKSALRAQSNLATAYQGSTRKSPIKSADWQKAGYKPVIIVNKLLGFSDS